jgi:LuxR family maltose regulon positive regulatory protein
MAEPPATIPVTAAPAEQDVLLATKLHVPRPRPGFVRRPRLLERLAEGMGRELVLVCTPAGFGKTTLLGDWARHGRRPVAWLSLDAGDNDPTRFWRHVAAALDGLSPGVAERVGALLQGLQPGSGEAVVTALVNQLTGMADEVVLVLDDYHLIQAPAIHNSLTLLLDRLPPELRLVLASRADPPLPLARLRARGQLIELRAADLRFTTDEAAALLREAVGSDLPETAVAALEGRTEGWAAGLQLAALSLQGHANPAGFVATFSGSHRFVLDYLVEEVLDRQPEPLRRFLRETSVLERLSGPLCDAVTGRGDSQRLLEQVERANLFLVPLDEVRGWWRYHHLFADLLRARLEQKQPDRVPQLHRYAASWHEQHELADDAVRHALAAGDSMWAARLVERHFDGLLLRGEGMAVQRWLAALPAEILGSRPRLLLAQALQALLAGRVEETEGYLDAAERAWGDAAGEADEPYEPSVGRAASRLANVPAAIALERGFLAELRGDAERTTMFASRALAELREGEWILGSLARWDLGVADQLRGRVREAERAFASNVAVFQAAGEPFLAVRVCHYLGHVQRAQGRLSAARQTYNRALEIATASRRTVLPAAGVAYVGLAEVAYQRGELDAALRHVTSGIALCRQLAFTQPLATGLAMLAWIRQAHGDTGGACEAIGEAERVAPGPQVVALLNPVSAQRARLLLAQGDIAGAVHWAEQRGLGADDEPRYAQEPEYLVLARVLLARGAPDRALGLLERLYAQSADQGRVASIIEARALQALAHAAAGDELRGLAALAEALALGAPEGYLRMFVDEGPPMAALLRKLLLGRRSEQTAAAGPAPRDYLARLVESFEQAGLPMRPPTRPGAVVVPGLVEPLSARELEVLALLAAGSTNRVIAEELVVTPETVKKHVSHIFDKLGAANRTQAVARARELGLLP